MAGLVESGRVLPVMPLPLRHALRGWRDHCLRRNVGVYGTLRAAARYSLYVTEGFAVERVATGVAIQRTLQRFAC